MKNITIQIANENHIRYSQEICDEMEASAKVRGTGIAKRSAEYIEQKMLEGKVVIAIDDTNGKWAGFCYIETWQSGEYLSNSGLIISPEYRKQGLAKEIKGKIFELSREKFPNAKIFGLTTGLAVMKINSDLGYEPVTYSELTNDELFWSSCTSCVNYNILTSKEFKNCMCTAMLYDPEDKKSNNKVVLAYSGGLDTTYCAVYLNKVKKYEVHVVTINTGAFTDEDIAELEKKSLAVGAASFKCIDVRKKYYNDCIKYLIFGNVLKNGTYPLSVSAERIIQSITVAEYAKSLNVNTIAHGSTGAGNDQIRFDMIIHNIMPDANIVTPIRDEKLSREEEIDFLKANGIEYDFKKATYSINKGIWGTSVGGKETLTSNQYLPEEAWPTQVTQTEKRDITLTFNKGELTAIDGVIFNHPVDAIEHLQSIAQPFGIGRDIHVGDTIIGIKGRVGFEAAAPILIIKAHHLLEKHTLTKWQLSWKDQLASFYGNWLHEGQMLDPIMRDVEAFLINSQKTVSGDVFVTLMPYRFLLNGISSPHDLMSNKFGTYGEMNKSWTGNDVKGFTKIFGNQTSIYHQVNNAIDNE